MKETTKKIYEQLLERYPALDCCKDSIMRADGIIENCYKTGGKLLLCGNGGSASDCEHIVGELMKSFKKKRAIKSEVKENLLAFGEVGASLASSLEGGLSAVSLTSHLALSTAFSNDVDPSLTFAQQLYSLANKNDALIAISTSGNSDNCVKAVIVAKAFGLNTIALTGEKDSKLSSLCNVTVKVPARETFMIQEYHLPIYHALCAMLEEEFFD